MISSSSVGIGDEIIMSSSHDSIGDEIIMSGGELNSVESDELVICYDIDGELSEKIEENDNNNDNLNQKGWTTGWGTLQIWYRIDVCVNEYGYHEYLVYFNAKVYKQLCRDCGSIGKVILTDSYVNELNHACTSFLHRIGLVQKSNYRGRSWSFNNNHMTPYCCACLKGCCTYNKTHHRRENGKNQYQY